jgi:1,4-dihydroxy-2-naphthoate octaprenyltransferase
MGVGAACVVGAVMYAGGPRPYGSIGFGEVAVFVFFGLVATCGTAYVHARDIPAEAWWSSVGIGLLAVAILVANNLRDIPTDEAANKRTLAVRLGAGRTRTLYRAVVVAGLAIPVAGVVADVVPAEGLLALVAAPLALRPLRDIGDAEGPALVPVLPQTAAVHAVAGLGVAVGLWVS